MKNKQEYPGKFCKKKKNSKDLLTLPDIKNLNN